jgi:starch-binding outer membrane protein, SusD/RagB family
MQKRYLSLALAAALTLTACDDDGFLTEDPQDFVGPANFYRNAGDAVAAVNAVYATFINTTGDSYYGRNFPILADFPTEMLTSGRLGGTNERAQPDNYSMHVDHAYIRTVWESAYQAINRANVVIGRVPAIDMDAALRDRIVGEAKFLRALHYFNLVRLFGGVPLRLEETTQIGDLEMPRSTAAEVYARIVQDLTEAIPALPATYPAAERGRATAGAAQTLLGKALVQRAATGATSDAAADYNAAIAALNAVRTSGRYTLVADFLTMFDVYGGRLNENNTEFIFWIENVRSQGLGGRLHQHVAPLNSGLGASNQTSITSELSFFLEYATTDTRRDGTWLLSYRKPDNSTATWAPPPASTSAYIAQTPFPRKYLDPAMQSTGAEEPNYPILRYADVLLLLAEAINEVQGPTAEAQEYLNQVRRRAGIGDFAPTGGVTASNFKDEIFLQRRKEFVLEFQGHFDSVRHWNWAKARIEANLQRGLPANSPGQRYPRIVAASELILTDKHKLFPIPLRAIQLSKGQIEQNPGWAPAAQ